MKETSKSITSFFGQLNPILVILTVLTPFVMISSLFFPFITGKAFYFRIIVELLLGAYLLHAFFDRSVWPKKSIISIAVGVFMLILGISTIGSVDPLRSFWSNYERMEGYVLFLHLGIFFLAAGAVMKYHAGWWKWFFRASLGMSVMVGLDAFKDFYSDPNSIGYRIFGNLGNSSYLGVYALISVFICLYFIVRRLNRKVSHPAEGQWVSLLIYSLIGIFNLVVLFNTGTRGSFVGLVVGIGLASILIALFEKKNKALRVTGISLIAIAVLFVLTLGAFKQASFIKKSDMLSRFAELVTLDVKGVISNQGKARSLLWGIAWEGVKDKPVLGWGLENFHYVFAKHYTPAMSQQEHWFDRSHNVFMDWLVGTGFVGLISYLGLFGASGYVLWRKREEDMQVPGAMSIAERAVLSGGLIAYLGHNVFVFDNLTSYVLFFATLAFLHQYAVRGHVATLDQDKSKNRFREWSAVEVTTLLILVATSLVYVLYVVNVRPIQANSELIGSLRAQKLDVKQNKAVAVDAMERFNHLKASIALGTMTNAEQTEQLAERGSDVFNTQSLSAQERFEVHQYVITKYEEAIKRTPTDPRPMFFYAIYLVRIGAFDQAEKISAQVLALSPDKIPFLNFHTSILTQLGKKAEALTYAQKAYTLAPINEESYRIYISALGQNGNFEEAEKIAGTQITKYLSDWNVIKTYVDAKQSARIIALLKKQIAIEPQILDLRSSLAAAYAKSGNIGAAVQVLEEVKKIAPQYATQVNQSIEQIKSGQLFK